MMLSDNEAKLRETPVALTVASCRRPVQRPDSALGGHRRGSIDEVTPGMDRSGSVSGGQRNAKDGSTPALGATIAILNFPAVACDGWGGRQSGSFEVAAREGTLPGVPDRNVLIDGRPGMNAPGLSGAALQTDATHLHNLEISYVEINSSAPERVYYRYRLVGEDADWQEAGMRRQAFYTRLNPGSYQFVISASTGEGWSDLPVPLRIELRPAVYQTWLFKTLCGAALLTIAWFFEHNSRYLPYPALKLIERNKPQQCGSLCNRAVHRHLWCRHQRDGQDGCHRSSIVLRAMP